MSPKVYRLAGPLYPAGLVGLEVILLAQPIHNRPLADRLVSIRFKDPEKAARATDGVFGHHPVRVPPACLERV